MRLYLLFLLLLSGGAALAQPAFEVASVKPAGPLQRGRPVGMRGGPGTNDPGQISWNYITLQDLLLRAYDVKEFQLSGPGWLASERYDVTAKLPPATDQKQFQLMLQNLLAERFHVKLHRETQQIPIYELVVAKGGPKFKESRPDTGTAPTVPAEPVPGGGPPMLHTGADGIIELPASMHGKGHMAIRSFRGAELRVGRESLGYLIERLTAELHRQVLDKTGLTGTYDYALAYLPETMMTSGALRNAGGAADSLPPAAGSADSATERRPDLFSALQSQLGLKLEPKKVPGEVLVIDYADKTPTEN